MTDTALDLLYRIADKQDKMDDSLSEIKSDLARLDERTDALEKTVDRLSHVLIEGNGRPSLLSRVDRLEVHVESDGKTTDLVGTLKLAEVEADKSKWEAVKAYGPVVGGAFGLLALLLQLLFGAVHASPAEDSDRHSTAKIEASP